jgi:hypothetical protein
MSDVEEFTRLLYSIASRDTNYSCSQLIEMYTSQNEELTRLRKIFSQDYISDHSESLDLIYQQGVRDGIREGRCLANKEMADRAASFINKPITNALMFEQMCRGVSETREDQSDD